MLKMWIKVVKERSEFVITHKCCPYCTRDIQVLTDISKDLAFYHDICPKCDNEFIVVAWKSQETNCFGVRVTYVYAMRKEDVVRFSEVEAE